MNFEDARAAVASETGQQTESWGWENEDIFQVVLAQDGLVPPLDQPNILVDKASGSVRKVYGTLGLPPAPNLRQVGTPPTP